MRKRILLFGCFLVFSICSFSQQNDSHSVGDTILADTVKVTPNKEKQKKEEKVKKGKKNDKVTLESLQKELSIVRSELEIYRQKDSIISARQDSANLMLVQIIKQQEKIKKDSMELVRQRTELQKQLEDYDRVTARFCYIRLSQRYNKKWIDEALDMWKKISAPSVLEEYKNVDELLKRYEAYYIEIRSIIQDAQNDEKGRKFNDVASDYAKRHLAKLHDSEYYRACFKKDCKIPYLDQQIELFESILKETVPGKYDFQIILSYGFPLQR